METAAARGRGPEWIDAELDESIFVCATSFLTHAWPPVLVCSNIAVARLLAEARVLARRHARYVAIRHGSQQDGFLAAA
jgi:hypothetical protein